MFQHLILLFALIFAGWLVFKILLFWSSLWVSPAELTIMPFDGTEAQKKQGPAILSAKLREIKARGRTAPTGYGLLNVPLLESGPQQTEQTAEKTMAELDKIQLKIKDVDVSSLIRAFDALLTPARYELRGTVVELSPPSLSVICQLVRREKVIASWEASGKASPAGAAAAPGATLEDLLDQVLYQMVFDFSHDAELKKEWKISISRAESFTNWQSLRAYVRGLRALRSYQESLEPADLKEASQFFEKLAKTDPANPYGLYFRGLALSEDRQEAESLETFVQLQRVLQRQADPDKWKAMLREAQLNEAITRLKLYRLEEGNKAVTILEKLIGELTAELQSEIPPEERKSDTEQEADASASLEFADAGGQAPKPLAPRVVYTTKLLAICDAQLAYTHGTILSFLRYEKLPSSDEVNEHATEMENNLKLADQTFKSLENSWASLNEKLDVQFRIENARGYGRYRLAFFRENKQPAKPNEATPYQQACKEAIVFLEKANEDRPNHYEVIQNLAMIYADEDYDPSGDSLPQAIWLFNRTKEFVPNDFYQFEQLAKIHLRLMGFCSTNACRKREVDAGTAEANKAIELPIELRSQQSASALRTLALLSLNKWKLDKRDDAAATAALDAIENAIPFPQPDTAWQAYMDFLGCLAETRKSSATGSNELVARVISLVRVPKLEPAAKEKLRTFALEWVEKVLTDTADTNKPGNVEPHAHAVQLKDELSAL